MRKGSPLSAVAWALAAAQALIVTMAAVGASPRALASDLAQGVIVVANSRDPDSVAIARHYAQVRGVPYANVIALRMPLEETITWRQFVGSVWQPLQDELVKRGWIDALSMDLFDGVGRRKYAISGHRIVALVTCRGVPLRIENDPSLYSDFKPYTDRAEFRTNAGAVDSELSLLAQTDYPINAGVTNPLYGNVSPTAYALAQVIKVSRLDGPTPDQALHLVDLAVEAERTGLLGRAYVDIAGPHENGDRWLATTAGVIARLGFDLSSTRGPGTMPSTARFDAPALYFGWYAADMNGPFTLPGFRFPPGAIAVHIHSFSAQTLRSETQGWSGPLVARGVTATVGNVFEPYLEYVHRPDLMMVALARGQNLVDAAYYALPLLSWQAVLIGDPLYRPFAVPLRSQSATLSSLPPDLAGYAVIRQMNLLDAQGMPGEAITVGKAGLKQAPNLALALALARRIQATGNAEEPVWIVKGAAESADAATGNWELLKEAATYLSERRRPAEAIEVYRRLFAIDMIPLAVKSPWLVEARRVALESGDAGQAAEWNEQIGKAVEAALGPKP